MNRGDEGDMYGCGTFVQNPWGLTKGLDHFVGSCFRWNLTGTRTLLRWKGYHHWKRTHTPHPRTSKKKQEHLKEPKENDDESISLLTMFSSKLSFFRGDGLGWHSRHSKHPSFHSFHCLQLLFYQTQRTPQFVHHSLSDTCSVRKFHWCWVYIFLMTKS